MKVISLGKKFVAAIAVLILASMAVGALLTQMYFPNVGTVTTGQPEDPLEAWSEASYIIWQYNSTFYACRNMSTWDVESLDSNKTYVEQMAIGNLTVVGGTIYLKQVTFNTTLTYGANILIIEDYQGQLCYYRGSRKSYVGAPQPYSYVIDTNGTHYSAFNGTTGFLEQTSTNGSAVGNFALQNCSDTSIMKVLFKGDFTIDTSLHVKSQTVVEVQGTITRSANVPIFIFDQYNGTSTTGKFNDLSGGVLDGSGYSSDMIQILNTKDSKFHDFNVKDFLGNGIYISASSSGGQSFYNIFDSITFGFINESSVSTPFTEGKAFIYVGSYATDCTISHCVGSGSGLTGSLTNPHPIGIWLGTGGWTISYNHFDQVQNFLNMTTNFKNYINIGNNILDYCWGNGIVINANAMDVRIHDNTVMGIWQAGTSLIVANGGTSGYIKYLDIVDNHFVYESATWDYCINFIPSPWRFTNWQIANNELSNGTIDVLNRTGCSFVDPTRQYILRDNLGFRTENWVSGTNTTATTIVLNHGLVGTPTSVFASFNFTGWTSWSWTATSTQITLTLTGSLPASYMGYVNVNYHP